MVTISRITTQKRNQHRYNVYIHNGEQEEYAFSVDEDLLVQYHLRKGLNINQEKISQLIEQDTVQKAYHQVLNYLSYRMRTKEEVRQYLMKKEVDENHIEQILQKLIDQKLLDDEEFAKLFVHSRIRSSTKGPLLIQKELMNKGIAETIAHQSLNDYTYEIQMEKAKNVVEKRLQKTSKHSFARQLEQSKATLQRKGFTLDVILDVIEQFQDDKDDDAEWHAIQHQGEKLCRKYHKKYSNHELQQKVKQGLYRQGFSIELINKFLTNQVLKD